MTAAQWQQQYQNYMAGGSEPGLTFAQYLAYSGETPASIGASTASPTTGTSSPATSSPGEPGTTTTTTAPSNGTANSISSLLGSGGLAGLLNSLGLSNTGGNTGGNFNQNQTGGQVGGFNTGSNTNSSSTGNTGSSTTGVTTGANSGSTTNNQNTSGANTNTSGGTNTNTSGGSNFANNTGTNFGGGTNTGTSNTGGSFSNHPIDTLGFGGLLQGMAPGAQANDATRNSFLTDFINTGGTGLNSQVDQAVRNSLSGPSMSGAGESASARAAGYGAAQIARQNADQRLSASAQLGQPGALQNLIAAGNPYLGQEGTSQQNTQNTGTTANYGGGTSTTTGGNSGFSNGTSTGFSNGTNTGTTSGGSTSSGQNSQNTAGNTSGFQSLINTGSENSAGTAVGGSTQSASGQVPTAQPVSSGGGCGSCIVGTELGLYKDHRILNAVVEFKLNHPAFFYAACGYFFLFTPIALYLLNRPKLARLLFPLAKATVYEELRISRRKRVRFKLWPWLVHWTGHYICDIVGRFPVPFRIADQRMELIARKHNIWYQILQK